MITNVSNVSDLLIFYLAGVSLMRNDVTRINRAGVIHLLSLNEASLTPYEASRRPLHPIHISRPYLSPPPRLHVRCPLSTIVTMYIESSQSARY